MKVTLIDTRERIGGTSFTPIVNYPEVAMLGLSRGRLETVVRHGEFVLAGVRGLSK